MFDQISVAAVKDYWDRRPCNIRHSTQPVGTREYFDEVEARKHFVEPHILDFAELGACAAKKCWRSVAASARRRSTSPAPVPTVTAVDLSEKSLELARQRAEVSRAARPHSLP